jgi:hypothetical protein
MRCSSYYTISVLILGIFIGEYITGYCCSSKHKSEIAKEEPVQCTICLCDLDSRENVQLKFLDLFSLEKIKAYLNQAKILQCGHAFHTSCIEPWFYQLELAHIQTRFLSAGPDCDKINLVDGSPKLCPTCKQNIKSSECVNLHESKRKSDSSAVNHVKSRIKEVTKFSLVSLAFMLISICIIYYGAVRNLIEFVPNVDKSVSYKDDNVGSRSRILLEGVLHVMHFTGIIFASCKSMAVHAIIVLQIIYSKFCAWLAFKTKLFSWLYRLLVHIKFMKKSRTSSGKLRDYELDILWLDYLLDDLIKYNQELSVYLFSVLFVSLCYEIDMRDCDGKSILILMLVSLIFLCITNPFSYLQKKSHYFFCP